MTFSGASGMHHGFAWVAVFCFASVVSVAESMQLQMLPHVTARCGENVTLACNFSSTNPDMQLIEFSLLAENESKVCKFEHDQINHEFLCVSKNKISYQTLTMILTNIMPVSEGKYICKVHSNKGVKSNRSNVKVQECSGSSNSFRNASHATCSFSGVYPSGVVDWFWGTDNVTEAYNNTKEEKDQRGLYKIMSTIRTKEDKLNYPYKCSLWIPSLNKYLSSLEVRSSGTREVKSSGTIVTLQWIFIVVEILMLSFRM